MVGVEFTEVHSVFESSIAQIKDEMEDHLESINCNTNEIVSNYEMLTHLDERLSKVEEKLDELLFAMGQRPASKYSNFSVPRLTKNEQEVYDHLMDSEQSLSYRDLAFKLALSQSLLTDYLASLAEKGIPLCKRFVGSETFVCIDPRFQDELKARKDTTKKVKVL